MPKVRPASATAPKAPPRTLSPAGLRCSSAVQAARTGRANTMRQNPAAAGPTSASRTKMPEKPMNVAPASSVRNIASAGEAGRTEMAGADMVFLTDVEASFGRDDAAG